MSFFEMYWEPKSAEPSGASGSNWLLIGVSHGEGIINGDDHVLTEDLGEKSPINAQIIGSFDFVDGDLAHSNAFVAVEGLDEHCEGSDLF